VQPSVGGRCRGGGSEARPARALQISLADLNPIFPINFAWRLVWVQLVLCRFLLPISRVYVILFMPPSPLGGAECIVFLSPSVHPYGASWDKGKSD